MWQWVSAVVIAMFSFGTGLHALLNKRDPRATLNWTLICIAVPGFGAVAYWILGVNRIQTKAKGWQSKGLFSLGTTRDYTCVLAKPTDAGVADRASIRALELISARVCRTPLVGGNVIDPLFNGEEAFPAMLDAIERAKSSINLCTYIFDTDDAGRRFVDALAEAAHRGVTVRVLLDAIGERYSRPRVRKLLRKAKSKNLKIARFLPLTLSLRGLRLNLRNHRKLIIVDGKVGFTGGMNLGQRHMVEDENNRNKTADVHFRLRGPVVASLEDMFFEDWRFATGETHELAAVSQSEVLGKAVCRAVPDGPNEDFEVLQWMLVGALSCAQSHVRIMTPYFIPGPELAASLNAASLRGVQVDVILPEKNNLPFVKWASQALLVQVLKHGTRVYYQPAPFNHSKMLLIDNFYTILGSANLDPRSLRLNFEFNVEVYDKRLSERLVSHFERVRERSRLITSEVLDKRNILVKIRDSLAKLGAPYL